VRANLCNYFRIERLLPKARAFGTCSIEAGLDALNDQATFELGDSGKDGEHQLAHRSSGVDVLGVADEVDAETAEFLEPIHEQVGSRESVDPPRLVLSMQSPFLPVSVEPQTRVEGLSLNLASNPFVAGAAIRLSVTGDAQHVVVDILDVRGRSIRRLFAGTMPAGQRSYTWDARDDAGRSVANGVYWVRATTPTARTTNRLALIKS